MPPKTMSAEVASSAIFIGTDAPPPVFGVRGTVVVLVLVVLVPIVPVLVVFVEPGLVGVPYVWAFAAIVPDRRSGAIIATSVSIRFNVRFITCVVYLISSRGNHRRRAVKRRCSYKGF